MRAIIFMLFLLSVGCIHSSDSSTSDGEQLATKPLPFELPKPTGNMKTGTFSFNITRPYGKNQEKHVSIQAWYPASPTGKESLSPYDSP